MRCRSLLTLLSISQTLGRRRFAMVGRKIANSTHHWSANMPRHVGRTHFASLDCRAWTVLICPTLLCVIAGHPPDARPYYLPPRQGSLRCALGKTHGRKRFAHTDKVPLHLAL